MATIAEKVFNFVIVDKAVHQTIVRELPEEKRAALMGRKGKIIITGPQGGVFTGRMTQRGFVREDDDSDIRNEVRMSDDTLLEILVWIAKLPGRPGISPRAAYVNGLITISGDSVLYDAEEIFTALEKHAFGKMGPIAKEAVEAMDKGVRE